MGILDRKALECKTKSSLRLTQYIRSLQGSKAGINKYQTYEFIRILQQRGSEKGCVKIIGKPIKADWMWTVM